MAAMVLRLAGLPDWIEPRLDKTEQDSARKRERSQCKQGERKPALHDMMRGVVELGAFVCRSEVSHRRRKVKKEGSSSVLHSHFCPPCCTDH